VIGDKAIAPLLDQMDATNPGDSKESMFAWSSEGLTFGELIETDVMYLSPKMSPCLYFNNDENSKFSFTQTIFVKREGTYKIVPTSDVEVGDTIIKVAEDGSKQEEVVETIHNIEEPQMTYLIGCEPQDWFIAGGYLVHNK